MAKLILRLSIIEKGKNEEEKNLVTKTLAVNPKNTVAEVAAQLRTKTQDVPGSFLKLGPNSEYGLFLPKEPGSKAGIWLDPDHSLEDYMQEENAQKIESQLSDEGSATMEKKVYLKSGDTIEYRKKMRILKVRTFDNTMRTLMVEDSKTVEELMDIICKRIGIPNNHEYSLASTKDATHEAQMNKKMETLKAKLHTEDEVNWLDHHKTLREQGATEAEPLIMRRKYFYTDVNVNKDDPIQLNMLYEQAKQAILIGTHPVAIDIARQLAAFMIQMQYGDHKEEKHTPGTINIKSFLPEGFKGKASSAERKILAEHKNLIGTSEIDAKFRYVKLARSLSTFGVHFFLVREPQKGKSRMIPLLLGITKDSILRLDYDTKETIETFPLTHVKRWAASSKIFSVDFGSHKESNFSVQTSEGEKISELVDGYVKIIMENSKKAKQEKIQNAGKTAVVGKGPGITIKLSEPQRALLVTIKNGQKQIGDVRKLLNKKAKLVDEPEWKEAQWNENQDAVQSQVSAVNAAAAEIVNMTGQGDDTDHKAVGEVVENMSKHLDEMAKETTILSALMDDKGENGNDLLEAMDSLLCAADELFKSASPENPKNNETRTALISNASNVGENSYGVLEILGLGEENEEKRQLLIDLAKDVAAATAALVQNSKAVASTATKAGQQKVIDATMKCIFSTSDMIACAKLVAPTIEDPKCKNLMIKASTDIEKSVENCINVAKENSKDEESLQNLGESSNDVSRALNALLILLKDNGQETMNTILEEILKASDMVISSQNLQEMITQVKNLSNASSHLIQAIKKEAENQEDADFQDFLFQSADNLAYATSQVLDCAKVCAANPNNNEHLEALAQETHNLRVTATEAVVMANRRKLIMQLENAAKVASYNATKCISAGNASKRHNTSNPSKVELAKACSSMTDAIPKMVEAIKISIENPRSARAQTNIIERAEDFMAPATSLVKNSQSALSTIDNEDAHQELQSTSELLEKSLKGLCLYLKKTKSATASVRMEAAKELINSLTSELDDLESALNAFELKPQPGDSKEKASANLRIAANNIESNIDKIKAGAANRRPDVLNDAAIDLGYGLEDFMSAVRELAATSNDPMEAMKLIEDAQVLIKNASSFLEETNKTRSANFDENSQENLSIAGENVSQAILNIMKENEENIESDEKLDEIKSNINEIMTKANKLIEDPVPRLDLAEKLSKATLFLIEELEKETEKESNLKIKDQIKLKVQMLKNAEIKLTTAMGKKDISKDDLNMLLEDMKLRTADAGDWIARNKRMKRLVVAAENASVKAEKYIKESRTSLQNVSATNDDLDNACTAVTDIISVLNESIDKTKQNSGSALAQSKLLNDSREFLEPSKSMLERSRSVLETMEDEDAKKTMMELLMELETSLANLSSEIFETEQVSMTLEVDAASELINSLKEELEDFQTVSNTLGLKRLGGETAEAANSGMINSAKSLRSNIDNLFTSAIGNNEKGINNSAFKTANNLEDFKKNVRDAVVTTSNKNEQKKLLKHTHMALENAEELMNEAKKIIRSPNNTKTLDNLSKASNNVSKALSETLLVVPGNEINVIKELMSSIESELNEFKESIQAFNGKNAPNDLPLALSQVKNNTKLLQDNAENLVKNVSDGQNEVTNQDSTNYAFALDEYLRSVKAVALNSADKKMGFRILNQAKQVVDKSSVLISEAHKTVNKPGESNALKELYAAEKDVQVALGVTLSDLDNEEDKSVNQLMDIREKIQTTLSDLNQSTDNNQKMAQVKNFAKSNAELIQTLKNIYANESDPVVKEQLWSSIEQLTNAVVDLSKAAKEFALNPNNEESKEVLAFAIEQTRLLSEQSINAIVRRKMADQLGLSAKKAVIATADCINESKKAIDQFPEECREIKNSLKSVSDAVSKLDKSADYFFQNPSSEAGYPRLLESSDQFIVPSNRLVEQATAVLGHLTSSKMSQRLLDTSEEMECAVKDLSTQIKNSESLNAMNIVQSATNDLNLLNSSITNNGEDFSTLKVQMINSSKEIYKISQEILAKSRSEPDKIGSLPSKLASHYESLVEDVKQALENDADDETSKDATLWVQNLGQSIMKLIESERDYQKDPDSGSIVMDVGKNAQYVGENCVKVLTALNAAAKRAQVLDNVSSELSGLASDLETTIMFASAGTMNPEIEGESFADHREQILKTSQDLVKDMKEILTGTTSSKEQLINAAKNSVTTTAQLCEEVKSGAASLTSENQQAQVMLLNTMKDVAASLGDLIINSKKAHGKTVDHPAMLDMKAKAKNVVTNVTHILKTVKTVEDENSRGTRAIESAIEAIGQEIESFNSSDQPKSSATPEDLMRANRAMTQATSKAVSASNSGNQDDIIAVANVGRKVISELLTTCKAAAFESENVEAKDEALQNGYELASQYQNLLNQVMVGVKNPSKESKAEVMNISRNIAQTVTKMAKLSEKLKGGDWVDPDDPMLIAENELLNAALSIEKAAKRLATLRPKKEVSGQEINDDDMTFDDLIIESAKSIANASSSLIKAASEAQKELVAQGKVQKKTLKGSEDGQWSEGLVSAAKMVASATHSLVEAANSLVQGEGEEEHLIAAAKQVSKSTAQLFLAFKVKADINSTAMEGLKTASNAIKKATDELVKSAQASIQEEPAAPVVKVDIFKERIEAEARVLKLEKELREAKRLEKQLSQAPQRSVGDIKKARDAEAKVLKLGRQLEEAQNFVQQLNKKQYEGNELYSVNEDSENSLAVERSTIMTNKDRKSIRALNNAGNVRYLLGTDTD